MKKNIFIISFLCFALIACQNANQKEIGEVTALQDILSSTEEVFLSVDTAKVFQVSNGLRSDFEKIHSFADTLDKGVAMKLAEVYSRRKGLYYFTDNYNALAEEIELAKSQLLNLKKDLKNNHIPKDKFSEYFKREQEFVVDLNNRISRSANGMNKSAEIMEEKRAEIHNVLDSLELLMKD